MLDVRLLILVQVNLEEPRSVETNADSLSNDLCWVDEVIEDGIVDSHKSAGPEKV